MTWGNDIQIADCNNRKPDIMCMKKQCFMDDNELQRNENYSYDLQFGIYG